MTPAEVKPWEPVEWAWKDGTGGKSDDGKPWFRWARRKDWERFSGLPLRVTLANGQRIIVRAKK